MKKFISLLLTATMLLSLVSGIGFIPRAEALAVQEDPSTELKIWYDEPANNDYNGWEKQSLPIGNSSIGGNVFGRYDTERVTLNEKTFWTGGPSQSRPGYMGGNLPEKGQYGKPLREIQKLFLAGNTATGSAKMEEHLIGANENGGYGGYQLFGNLYLDFKHKDVTNYNRKLNIMDGLATVDYDMANTHYSREYLTSFPDNVMAINLKAEGAGTLDFSVRLTPEDTNPARRTYTITGDNSSLVLAGSLNDNQLRFNGYLKVLVSGDGASSVKNGEKLDIAKAKDVTILLSMATDYANVFQSYRTGEDDAQLAARVKAVVEKAAQKDYAALRQAHIEDVSSLMDRVDLDLDAKDPNMPTDDELNAYKSNTLKQAEKNHLETLLYQFGRYLLVSSSRGDTLPANLQGIWVGKNGNSWSSDYHMNVNLQMNYWPAYSGNLTECALPLIDYVDSLREPGRVTADVYFGVKSTEEKPANGFTFHTQNTPFGWTCPGWSVDWGWSPAAAPWILQNCWEHYEYTGDLEFMKEKIYPMLKEETIFYSQIMRQDKNGKWLSTPAYSPEHGPRTNGNTYEQSLIWQLFTDTITAAKLVCEDPQVIAEWQSILDNLRTPIEIGTDGQVKEWYHETTLDSMNSQGSQGRGHRHISHMLGLFPGDLISEETPDWFKAARVSMEHRVDESTGWAMGQRINTWARLGDGNKAYELINILMKTGILTNLWDDHRPPFQIDGNFGYTSGVNEMLVQSNMDYLNILPALPDAWDHGSVDGILARGNFELGIDWYNNTPSQIRITSHKGNPATVQFTQGTSYTIKDSKGNMVQATPVEGKPNRITFDTVKDETYIIQNTLPLGTPTGLEAKRIDEHTIDLTWNPLHGAQKYNVYRSVNEGEYQLIAAGITEPHFSDTTVYSVTAQDSFQYKVSGIESNGNEGELSQPVSVVSRKDHLVDGADGSVKKTGEWAAYTDDIHYEGTNTCSWTPGSTAELTFTGTGIEAYTVAKPNYNAFYVYIDGEKQEGHYSAYAKTVTPNHLIYSNKNLPYDTHTIRLEVMKDIIPGSPDSVRDVSVSLDYFKVYEKSDSVIQSVDVTSLSGVTTLSHSGQKLQLAAAVSPSDASNTAVHWSVTNADGSETTLAEIDENGMVTLTGTGSGTLRATASSAFDSDVRGSIELTVTNSGADKTALLESLDRAALLLESDFDAAGWQAFTTAQKAAVEQANKADATEADISAAKTALDKAMESKNPEPALTGLKINLGSLNMSVGMVQPIQVTAIYDRGVPINCTSDAKITADSNLVTVSSDGNLTAVAAGTETLRASYNGKETTVSLNIVGTANGNLTITSTRGGEVTTSVAPPYSNGQSVTLTAIPEIGYVFECWRMDGKTLSENPLSVTVGSNTKVEAFFSKDYRPGSGGGGGSSSGSTSASVRDITISQKDVTLHKGETVELSAKITPSNAKDKTISWTTSDSAIAKVENGLVTAVNPGTATITARAGSKTATCTVTVLAAETEQTAPPKTWSFTDVPETLWYYESVRKAWENGLIDGVSATQFNPNSMLTVAESIKLAAALHQLDQEKKVTLSTTGAAQWYEPYVTYAANKGVIDKSYTTYTAEQMNAMVSRAEFVKIFHGAMSNYTPINTIADNSIPDVKTGDKNAAEIYDFFRAGILIGYNNTGSFMPTTNIKRSEVAAILIRMFDPSVRQSVSLQ